MGHRRCPADRPATGHPDLRPYSLFMLDLRPNCECCDRDLAVDDEAYICTFECTWCPACVERFPERACPNCGGGLERRPVRPARALASSPAGTSRVISADCRSRFLAI
jgi:hypothetical protein